MWMCVPRAGVLPAVLLFLFVVSFNAIAGEAPKTRVVVLGVEHAGQLFVRDYRPAVLRAWLERVQPDAIGIERDPEAYARNDFYGFTYEIQDILLPWAADAGIPAYPFDWEPGAEDQQLAFGFDLQQLPTLRPASGWNGFVTFDDKARNEMSLFLGEDPVRRERVSKWATTPVDHDMSEMARRLFLFRTQLQAQRIRLAAERHRGGTLVVVVGWMHQADIESHLARDAGIELVAASTFGVPDANEIRRHQTVEDLAAIAWANLFGVQSHRHSVDTAWLTDVVAALENEIPAEEHRVLFLRLRELDGRLSANDAMNAWLALAESLPAELMPSWTGLVPEGRLDSDFDPFAALTLRQRARHEASRLASATGNVEQAVGWREQVTEMLSGAAGVQYRGYWEEYATAR